MAIAVPSSAVTDLSVGSTDTVTITKPTGLAAGEIMVFILYSGDTTTPNTLAGWTAIQAQNSSAVDGATNRVNLSSFWKIASADDAAASNFAFTKSTASRFGGGILRITGGGGILDTYNQTG